VSTPDRPRSPSLSALSSVQGEHALDRQVTSFLAFFLFFLCVSATFCWIFLRSCVVPRLEVSAGRRGGEGALRSASGCPRRKSGAACALFGNALFLMRGMAAAGMEDGQVGGDAQTAQAEGDAVLPSAAAGPCC
jgi:hypothetical protein